MKQQKVYKEAEVTYMVSFSGHFEVMLEEDNYVYLDIRKILNKFPDVLKKCKATEKKTKTNK